VLRCATVLRRNDVVTNDIAVPVLIVGGGGAGVTTVFDQILATSER
jgi:hypothetical protein